MTDIRGKTLDEIMAQTERSIDAQFQRALESSELVLFDNGATPAELAAHRAHLEVERREYLAEIKRGLTDWDAPSVKLQ